MPVYLRHRQPELIEEMDKPDCNPDKLFRTYRHFASINSFLAGWRRIYTAYLKPQMGNRQDTYSLLDIGFGGGDIPFALSEWAQADGINLEITAIETDQRALEYVQHLPENEHVSFLNCSSSDLVKKHEQFDFVISNNLLHHLSESETSELISDSSFLAKKLVVFNDIKRSDLGFMLYHAYSRLFFRNSFVTVDGLASIKRSYTHTELAQLTTTGWRVESLYPFRLLLIHDKTDEG